MPYLFLLYVHFVNYTQNTTTVRSGKSTIGPVFVTVTEKPNQSDQRQVLIRFYGPPDTVLIVNEQKLNKVPGNFCFELAYFFLLSFKYFILTV